MSQNDQTQHTPPVEAWRDAATGGSVHITFRLSRDMRDQIRHVAWFDRRRITDVCRLAVEAYLKEWTATHPDAQPPLPLPPS